MLMLSDLLEPIWDPIVCLLSVITLVNGVYNPKHARKMKYAPKKTYAPKRTYAPQKSSYKPKIPVKPGLSTLKSKKPVPRPGELIGPLPPLIDSRGPRIPGDPLGPPPLLDPRRPRVPGDLLGPPLLDPRRPRVTGDPLGPPPLLDRQGPRIPGDPLGPLDPLSRRGLDPRDPLHRRRLDPRDPLSRRGLDPRDPLLPDEPIDPIRPRNRGGFIDQPGDRFSERRRRGRFDSRRGPLGFPRDPRLDRLDGRINPRDVDIRRGSRFDGTALPPIGPRRGSGRGSIRRPGSLDGRRDSRLDRIDSLDRPRGPLIDRFTGRSGRRTDPILGRQRDPFDVQRDSRLGRRRLDGTGIDARGSRRDPRLGSSFTRSSWNRDGPGRGPFDPRFDPTRDRSLRSGPRSGFNSPIDEVNPILPGRSSRGDIRMPQNDPPIVNIPVNSNTLRNLNIPETNTPTPRGNLRNKIDLIDPIVRNRLLRNQHNGFVSSSVRNGQGRERGF